MRAGPPPGLSFPWKQESTNLETAIHPREWIPAPDPIRTGIHVMELGSSCGSWIPAFAGMTESCRDGRDTRMTESHRGLMRCPAAGSRPRLSFPRKRESTNLETAIHPREWIPASDRVEARLFAGVTEASPRNAQRPEIRTDTVRCRGGFQTRPYATYRRTVEVEIAGQTGRRRF